MENPQSEKEIMDSFELARKHPTIFILKKQSEINQLLRRWADLGKFDGEAEIYYQMVQKHLEMAATAIYLLNRKLALSKEKDAATS